MDETIAKARHARSPAQEKIVNNQFLLDEFTFPLQYGWLGTDEVLTWVKQYKPSRLHLIITGRDTPPELIALADLVTELQAIRDPFDQGVAAQPGIEV